jgi:Carbohydrate-selective porin, OprB family/S-layer homology domain
MLNAFQTNWNARFAVRLWIWTVLFSAVGMTVGGKSQIAQAEDLNSLQSVSQIVQQVNSDSPATAPVPAFTSNAPLIQATGNSEAQVTSVSQLSDVQPTDWAFQALQSLVERYGCIAGYPDGTFKGNRAATRYELAAALNACLDQVSDRFATKEDLATVKALQEEFKTELATLKGRVDGLEARTKTLEAQQFSTTTKLTGNAFFNITGAASGSGVKAEGLDAFTPGRVGGVGAPIARTGIKDPNVTFSGLVWLNFNTSFTGKDLLRIQLASGTGNSPLPLADWCGSTSTPPLQERICFAFSLPQGLVIRLPMPLLQRGYLIRGAPLSPIKPLEPILGSLLFGNSTIVFRWLKTLISWWGHGLISTVTLTTIASHSF